VEFVLTTSTFAAAFSAATFSAAAFFAFAFASAAALLSTAAFEFRQQISSKTVILLLATVLHQHFPCNFGVLSCYIPSQTSKSVSIFDRDMGYRRTETCNVKCSKLWSCDIFDYYPILHASTM